MAPLRFASGARHGRDDSDQIGRDGRQAAGEAHPAGAAAGRRDGVALDAPAAVWDVVTFVPETEKEFPTLE